MKIAKALIFAALVAPLWGQVPQGVTVTMDEGFAPDLGVLMYWQPVPGAAKYNVYKAPAGNILDCHSAMLKFDESVTATTYSDNPNPGWYLIPVTGNWGSRGWCYAVSSVVNGVESAQSAPQFIAIGWSGYLNLTYVTACGGSVVVPFPYVHDELTAQFFYREPAGVNHEFSSIHLHAPWNDPAHYYNEEWEFKLPTVAIDGTMIPWSRDAFYYYELRTPDGGNYAENLIESSESRNLDQSYYTQLNLNRVLNGPDCQRTGSNSWQNVTR